ncbi:hypothetical protein BG011_006881 [Mortierella polycephala]|uniref:Uncharacterized protein n=1 Tax=Mortierella polycephala TaxID=41804 RepID=A0A9P6U8S4_9FUNG|nr:hypothetical protein BG011_006881 [Mortierella polycephala]
MSSNSENSKEPALAEDKEGSLSQDRLHIDSDTDQVTDKSQEPLYAVAQELAQEFSIESLSTPSVKEAQGHIQTVALQMDGIRTQVGQIQDQIPGINQQTKALIEGATAMDQMYMQIDRLAILVESVAADVHDMNSKMDEAERELTTTALQPLQAVLESLKMGPKGFR